MRAPSAFTCLVVAALALATTPRAAVAQVACDASCPEELSLPVCDSAGRTYPNRCAFEQAHCLDPALTEGECVTEPTPVEHECPEECTAEINYVCADNGSTHNNLCELSRVQCKSADGATPAWAHDGRCDDSPPADSNPPIDASECPQFCTDEISYVCGDDGESYSNMCQLRLAQCKSETKRPAWVRDGRCDEAPPTEDDCPEYCTFQIEYVCADDGSTHNNLCELARVQCKSLTGKSPAFVRDGRCEDSDDPTSSTPPSDEEPIGQPADVDEPTMPVDEEPIGQPSDVDDPTEPTDGEPIGQPTDISEPPSDEGPIGQPTDLDEPTPSPPVDPTSEEPPTEPPTDGDEPTPAPTSSEPSDVDSNGDSPPVSSSPTPEPVTPEPTEAPTPEPSEAPTPEPTKAPTPEPTEAPTPEPTEAPTPEPTEAPTPAPTEAPTPAPTEAPTPQPTKAPTPAPTTTKDDCPLMNPPICGSDGITYENLCWIALAKVKTPSLSPLYFGPCVSESPAPSSSAGATQPQPWDKDFDMCSFLCPMLHDPVCTPDGQVFNNMCTYASAFCRDTSLAVAKKTHCAS